MFNTLREELDKIALLETDDLEFFNDHTVDGDEGAADDELYDDIEEAEEEEEFDDLDTAAVNEAIDMLINEMIVNESLDENYDNDDDYDYDEDDYYNEEEAYGDDVFDDDYDDFEDDEDDEVDFDDGVIGDGETVKGEPEDDEYDEVDIGGVTNAIHGDYDLKEDLEDEEEDDLDELLEAMLSEAEVNDLRANANDIYGDSADMPTGDVPPAPQYSKITGRCGKSGMPVPDSEIGRDNYGMYGGSKFSKDVLNTATVDDDEYDEEGNAYDLYASAGNIYDDDENEEYYGIRNRVSTKNLFGRHNINNINYAQLGDRFAGPKDALDESVEMFLRGLR